jgi:hypothetical protein
MRAGRCASLAGCSDHLPIGNTVFRLRLTIRGDEWADRSTDLPALERCLYIGGALHRSGDGRARPLWRTSDPGTAFQRSRRDRPPPGDGHSARRNRRCQPLPPIFTASWPIARQARRAAQPGQTHPSPRRPNQPIKRWLNAHRSPPPAVRTRTVD